MGLCQRLCVRDVKNASLDYPDDFVLGTGESHNAREFAEVVFREVRIDPEWIGSGINEDGIFNDETMVKVSREYYRPLESDNYKADYSKAKQKLRWELKTKFKDLLKIIG